MGRKRHEYLSSIQIEENIKKYLDQGKIYIPFCVVSSKNSKQIGYSWRKRSRILISSNQYQYYRQLVLPYFLRQKKYFLQLVKDLPKPYILGFHHIRYCKERWDHHNMMQGPADLMQEAGWIEDDDIFNISIHPDGYTVDKHNQGLIITPYESVAFKRIGESDEKEISSE